MKCDYFECSAKTSDGLKELFLESMRKVLKTKKSVKGKKGKKEGDCTLI